VALTQEPDESKHFRIRPDGFAFQNGRNSAHRSSIQRQPSALSSSRRTITAGSSSPLDAAQ
jgi:hypothetical protein